MELPPSTDHLGSGDPYPSGSLYPLESNREHDEYQNHLPPSNPPWALRPQHCGATGAASPTYPSEQGDVPLYPPPSRPFRKPRSEPYPPELCPHEDKSSASLESDNDSWIHDQEIQKGKVCSFDPEPSYPNSGAPCGGAIPSQPYPYLHSTSKSYPPSSFSDSLSSDSSSPHASPASTTPSAPPPPPPDCPPAYPSASTADAQLWCAPPAAILPSAGPGLSFGGEPPSAHPLLQSVEDDIVPYEEGGGDQSEDVTTGYGEEFDYWAHKALEKFGINLTSRANEGWMDPVIGRDLAVRQCIEILTRKSKCNYPVLVGNFGIGRTAVVEGLAQRIVKGDVPEALRGCKIISVDFEDVFGIRRTLRPGSVEGNMKELIEEAAKAERKVILFLDELQWVFDAAARYGDHMDTASEMFRAALARGDFLCIGKTTDDTYDYLVEHDKAFAKLYQKVLVDPLSPEDSIFILRGLKPRLEGHFGISIADDAVIAAVKLSERYIPDRYLPDKALELVRIALTNLARGGTPVPAMLFQEIELAILDLDTERLSVTGATGQASQERLQQILLDLEGLKSRHTNLRRKRKKEKALATRILYLIWKIRAVKMGADRSSMIAFSGLESPTEESSGFETANLKELEAQLETAEKEWKEYENYCKPLIQLEVTSSAIVSILRSGTSICREEMRQLLRLDIALYQRVIGQDEACNAIARAIQRSRAGLSDPKRPIASLMFMGPTGVGKTESAKALMMHLFYSENAMVWIDMSEYGEKASISRLTGHGDGGQLTTPVRRRPCSVVLFDGIEKANNDIFNIILQILDDGRLTDSEGEAVEFTKTLIIITSHVGAEIIMEGTANSNACSNRDEAHQVMKSQVMEAARAKYRPEFINRIDEFIVFQPLNRQHICEIVELQLDRLSIRLQDRPINLRVSESAVQLLSSMGYDPRYGARPVEQVIQQSIEEPLAQGIRQGQYTDGCTVMVDTEFCSVGPSQQSQQRFTFCKLP